jgi:hypothetical protein
MEEEIHPIADTPLYKALPWLCCCTKKCSKNHSKTGENEALLGNSEKKPKNSKKAAGADMQKL